MTGLMMYIDGIDAWAIKGAHKDVKKELQPRIELGTSSDFLVKRNVKDES